MSRATQSRAQTEANAKTLRALVKHPDNKVCVDCKKNDPRWASWNIGCFLCIRCSGIHRSMGTHISKVKSIDLDIWTPEQMESVQKWGNRRCNLYWEAHLKAGHVPADHKIESFIRSKYESRRWAKDGPPPTDPGVLDGAASPPPAPANTGATSTPAKPPASVAPTKAPAIDLLDEPSPSPTPAPTSANASLTSTKSPTSTATPAPAKPSGGGGIFDLDWHDPSPSTATATAAATSPTSPSASSSGAKGKNDIMSLFAAARPSAPTQNLNTSTTGAFADFGSFSSASSAISNPASATGAGAGAGAGAGLGALNSSFGGLDLSSSSAATRAPISNPWSTTTNASTNNAGAGGLFNTQDVWGSTTASNVSAPATTSKNDAFADIWGDFK